MIRKLCGSCKRTFKLKHPRDKYCRLSCRKKAIAKGLKAYKARRKAEKSIAQTLGYGLIG